MSKCYDDGFIPGYSDEPQYWDDATINRRYMRENVVFIKRKLQMVCAGKVRAYEYYDGPMVVRVSTDADVDRAEAMLKEYVKHIMFWRGTESGGRVDWHTEIWGFKDAEFDGYRLHKLRGAEDE